jgi:hypothetical protein
LAAIVTKVFTKPIQCDDIIVIRNETAQATIGQTDWIDVPLGATYAQVVFNLTDVGVSTTPIMLPSVFMADPVARNDTYKVKLGEHAALTAFTAANMLVMNIGPGVTGIADDVTNSATAVSVVAINTVLPWLMGFTVLNDRTTGDEVYSYTISVVFRT